MPLEAVLSPVFDRWPTPSSIVRARAEQVYGPR
jgi:hypothetical protein